MTVKTNISALNTNRMLGLNNKDMSKHMEKLNSGYRINRSADDASGLAVSETMRRQIRGLTRAAMNAQDAISLCQVADGALNEVHDMLCRAKELAVQAANGTIGNEDKEFIQMEIESLSEEIDIVHNSTFFNNQNVFGDATERFSFQVGTDSGQEVSIYKRDITCDYLFGGVRMDVSTENDAQNTIANIANAGQKVDEMRSYYGAIQNRFEHTINNIKNITENTTSSESRIRDTDMATKMMEYSKTSILARSGTAMLTHANKHNDGVLGLLR